eukprot:TRINITY_DN15017_c0_g1_i1.p1 TRINITY_DN15017_c0_g1~~TRINITY_DN15017_c0_g1_i1.p1  ORF type:complete len:249 (+),score=41.43 TRINITY_DN15017_c0_g1_i1:63-749(+)
MINELREPDELGYVVVDNFIETGFDGELRLEESQNETARLKLRISVVPARIAANALVSSRNDEERIEAQTRAKKADKTKTKSEAKLTKSKNAKTEKQVETQVIYVTLIGASGLRDADYDGSSDPFATCQIVGSDAIVHQTKVVENTLDPEWNEEFEIADYDWKRRPALKFFVLDDDGALNQYLTVDKLGHAVVDNFADAGFDGEVMLEDSQNSTARLRLRIRVGKPAS